MNYTVTAVKGSHEWTHKDYGQFVAYLLELDGEEKAVELSQKPDTRAPTVGQVLDLKLGPHPRFKERLKATKVEKQGAGGGPRPEDPKRSRAILRQHSQHMALLYFQLKGTPPGDWGEFWGTVDKFDTDVERAREAA